MKNKIKHKIINTAATVVKWLRTWLTQPDTVRWARPFRRDVRLNSSKAITTWLAMIDQPTTFRHGDTIIQYGNFQGDFQDDFQTKGGGRSRGETD
jgi:hypothetical protein